MVEVKISLRAKKAKTRVKARANRNPVGLATPPRPQNPAAPAIIDMGRMLGIVWLP